MGRIERAPPERAPNQPADEELAALLTWRDRSVQLYDTLAALSAEEREAWQQGLSAVSRIIERIEAGRGVSQPNSLLEVVSLMDLFSQVQGPAASAAVAQIRGLAALDVVLQQQADFRVHDFIDDDVEGTSIRSQVVVLQERLGEAMAEPHLPNLAVWLNTLWDRFGGVTGQFLAEFVPKLRVVSCRIATLSVRLTAPHQHRAPHHIALGSFAVSLLCSGIFAPEVLKPPQVDLYEWKRALDVFRAEADVGYEGEPLCFRNSMLIMIHCTCSTAEWLQECTTESVHDIAVAYSRGVTSDPKLEVQTSQ